MFNADKTKNINRNTKKRKIIWSLGSKNTTSLLQDKIRLYSSLTREIHLLQQLESYAERKKLIQ